MERTSPKAEVVAISLSDLPEDIEFKKNVCYPYFKDIYKVRFGSFQDLANRSDDPDKGINKITMLEVNHPNFKVLQPTWSNWRKTFRSDGSQ